MQFISASSGRRAEPVAEKCGNRCCTAEVRPIKWNGTADPVLPGSAGVPGI